MGNDKTESITPISQLGYEECRDELIEVVRLLEQGGLDLEKCFRNSYVTWCGVPWEPTPESRARLLTQIRHNSYFVWFERALRDLYLLEAPLSAETSIV